MYDNYRVCPGKHMGLSSLWINVASLLHSFNISEALDGAGNPIKPRVKYVPGVLKYVNILPLFTLFPIWFPSYSTPAPFQCTIKPRSEGHAKIIKQALINEAMDV